MKQIVRLALLLLALASTHAFCQKLPESSANDYDRAIVAFRNEQRQVLTEILQRARNGCSLEVFSCQHLALMAAEHQASQDNFDEAESLLATVAEHIPIQDDASRISILLRMARASLLRWRGNLKASLAIWLTLAHEAATTPIDAEDHCRIEGELGYLLFLSGRVADAAIHYQREVDLATQKNLDAYRLHGMIGLGLVAKNQGRYSSAIDQLKQAADTIVNGPPDRHLVKLSLIHGNLAAIYKWLGQYDIALQHYQQARAYKLQAGYPASTTVWLDMIASILRIQGRNTEAIAILKNEYLPNTKNPAARYVAYRELALNQAALGDYEQAATNIEEAIGLRLKQKNLTRIGDYYADQGAILTSLQRSGAASDSYREGWAFSQAQNDLESRWKNLYGLFLVERKRGNTPAAILLGKLAVNDIQAIRSGIANLAEAIQQSFLYDKQSVFNDLADLLIEQNRYVEAQQVLAMLKQDEYHQFLERSAADDPRNTRASYVGVEVTLDTELQAITTRLQPLYQEFSEIEKKARHGLTAEEKIRRDTLGPQLGEARAALKAYVASLPERLPQADPARLRDLGQVTEYAKRYRLFLSELSSKSGGKVALLQYVLSEGRVTVLVTTPDSQYAQSAKIDKDFNGQILKSFLPCLSQPGRDPRLQSQTLYATLIGPIRAHLDQEGIRTLMLSPDGVLRYLPFAALWDGQHYLVETYRLAYFNPVVDNQNLLSTNAEHWRVGGLGLSDAVTANGESFDPLPSVQAELDGITRAIPGEVHLNTDFTKGHMKDVLGKAYPVVHIASHFVFKPEGLSSYLVLGKPAVASGPLEGDTLSLREFEGDAGYDLQNVDLLTLSACETGKGGGDGKEVEGFGSLAQKKGAKSVLATLWKVSDIGTESLMQAFYRLRDEQHLNKAEALRQAQLSLLTGKLTPNPDHLRGGSNPDRQTSSAPVFTPDSNAPYAHPYYWAPFILMGNWL